MYKAGDEVINRRGDVVMLFTPTTEHLSTWKLAYIKPETYSMIRILENGRCSAGVDDTMFDIVGYHQKEPDIKYDTDKDVWVAETNRGIEWQSFSNDALNHIERYTVPQYGDAPDDMLSNESPEYLMKQVQKYLNRFGKNQREGQELLDLLKMTHCIQIAYTKLKK